ncbi:FAD-dependent oxidoreductase [Paenibacillus sp. PAMC21692]|uniref:FAD-dependent oxidoreductase n=1 Tax=Paenibacillus sp. PAMC21692 TaxID=2762320 RepID=UPI00164D2FD8|nr:FAD-dependent oxidoreductase [Paenibacillus sp. PAMC21692]QNK59991.1 FAD-dependent oxidoreductase [Paenibacillus sp. PAMC21692]
MNAVQEVITADVLIAGGGTAGCSAAIAAAREGARTVLLDMDDGVGGVAVRANVSDYHFGSRGGLQNEVDRRVKARQNILGGREAISHPEAKRSVYGELLSDCGVRTMLGHLIYDVLVEDGAVVGVLAAGPEGPTEIRAKVTVDCTAEGDVSAMAGASYSVGRQFDGVSHSYSLCPRIMLHNPKTGKLRLHLKNFDAGWVHSPSAEDVSRAYQESRRHLLNLLESGKTDVHMLSVAPKLGIREGRHIVGDYVLALDDFLHDRHFEDVIARAFSYYDTHARDLGNESDFAQIWLVMLDMTEKKGLWCDIPYRSLLPGGVEGLLVSSRALSVDRDVSMAIRMQRDIQKIGEAAGVAAAMAMRLQVKPREVSVPDLQRRLVELGVLNEPDLIRTDTANLQFRKGELAERSLSPELVSQLPPAEALALARLLAERLGAEEQALAVWWLRLLGERAAEALLEAFGRELASCAAAESAAAAGIEHAARACGAPPEVELASGACGAPTSGCRMAAMALALLGRREAEPVLLHMFRSRLNGRANPGSYPEWIAALAALRLMGSKALAASEIVAALHEKDYNTGICSMLLQYLETVCWEVKAEDRDKLAEGLLQWSSRPGIGDNYVPPEADAQLSVRWNLQMRTGIIVARLGLGRQGRGLCETWLNDERVSVRRAAAKALERIESNTRTETFEQRGDNAG